MNDYEYLKSMMEDGIIQLSTEEKMKLLNTCNICYENQQLYVFNKKIVECECLGALCLELITREPG